MEHLELYGRLRASLISRRFAFNGPWRVNLPSNSGPIPGVTSIAEFNALSTQDQLAGRWGNTERQGENPWALAGGALATALSVETALGWANGRAALGSLLASAQLQFPIIGGEFAGYPVRWFPTATPPSRWRSDATGPMYSGEFPVNANAVYDYANRPSEFRRYPRRDPGTMSHLLGALAPTDDDYWGDIVYHRRWEMSQDEVFGLLAGLYAAHQISGDAQLGLVASSLMSKLADYLSRNGYLLVKPVRGLVGRGGGDSLVGSEYAIGRGFHTVLGQSFPSRTDFGGAMTRAGCWTQLKDAVAAAAALGDIAAVAAQLAQLAPESMVSSVAGLFNTLDAVASGACPALADAANDWLLPTRLAKALAVSQNAHVFDPYQESYRTEQATSIFYYEYDAEHRFRIYCQLCALMPATKVPVDFMGATALLALNDNDATVRDELARWFRLRMSSTGLSPRGLPQQRPLFTLAVMCLLFPGSANETALSDALASARDDFVNVSGADLPLVQETGKDSSGQTVNTGVHEDCMAASDYLAGLALAWLYARRRGAAGASVVTGFPLPPSDFSGLPRPATQAGTDLFPGDQAVLADPVPPVRLPGLPDVSSPPVVDKVLLVDESDTEVDTGITIHHGELFQITATGTIHHDGSSGAHGPGGTGEINDDTNWPLHSGIDPSNSKWSLLARLNGWFEVREDSGEQWWLYEKLGQPDASRRLYLRINGDKAGQGDGQFRVNVRTWGAPHLVFGDLEANGYAFIFPPSLRFALRCDENCGPPQVTIRVRTPDGTFVPIIGEGLGTQLPLSDLLEGLIDQHPAVLEPAGELTTVFWLGRLEGGATLFGRNDTYDFRLEARTTRGYFALAEISVAIAWHGERVSCIRRPPHVGQHRILAIGGVMPEDERKWTLEIDQAIAEIRRGRTFYVEQPSGHRVDVVVERSAAGHDYLKTVADGESPDNLLSLPECGT